MSRRLDKLDEERGRALFEAASVEFAEHGFDAASLNRILDRSGMSKSSLYYYFDDKADLFTTLVERSLDVVFRQIGPFEPEALERENFWSAFEAAYARAIAVVDGHGWLVKFGGMFYALRADPKRGAPTNRLFARARAWVERALERGRHLGEVRADLPASLLADSAMGLLESLDRWVVMHWAELSEADKQALPAHHVGLFRRLLAPDGGGGAAEDEEGGGARPYWKRRSD